MVWEIDELVCVEINCPFKRCIYFLYNALHVKVVNTLAVANLPLDVFNGIN